EFTRGPSTARMAGKVVRPWTTASATTSVLAQPIEPRLPSPRKSMPSRPIATVRPENRIAPAAVAVLRGGPPARVPARRLRRGSFAEPLAEPAPDEERVVDGDPEPDHADDVRRVDRDRDETGDHE